MNKLILVIDDEQDVLEYLTAVLESHGYAVVTAGTADDGWAQTQRHEPDLICLDIMMPGESGVSFYQRLKKSPRFGHIPVIIVSGMVKEEDFDAEKIISTLGVEQPVACIDKPIAIEIFIDAVGRGLTGSASVSEKRGKTT